MNVFTCPNCGAKYKVPPNAAGKNVKCKKCDTVSRIPDDEGPIPIADAPDFFAEAAAAAERGSLASQQASQQAPPAAGAYDALEDSEALREGQRLVEAGRQPDVRRTARTFWGDIGWSFMFLIEPGNIVTFVVICLLYAAVPVLGLAIGFSLRLSCMALIVQIILTGWIYSFLLNCIVEAASGEDDLPTLRLTDGVWDDVIVPFFQFVGAWAVLLAPAFIYLFVAIGMASSGLLAALEAATDPQELEGILGMLAVPFFVLLAIGVFLWPITILVVSMSTLRSVVRVDLILATVMRTFVPYLATFLLVALAITARIALSRLLENSAGVGTPWATRTALTLLGFAVVAYFNISTMRIIGLYYRHYKHRFAWSWE